MAGVAVGSTCTTLRIGKTRSVAPGLSPPKSEPLGDEMEPRFARDRNWAALLGSVSRGGFDGLTLRGAGDAAGDGDADVDGCEGTARPVGVVLSSGPSVGSWVVVGSPMTGSEDALPVVEEACVPASGQLILPGRRMWRCLGVWWHELV